MMRKVSNLLVIIFICNNYIFASSPNKNKVKWFAGSVEQALVQAKQSNRPLFLYWGAVWCPPCNQIKKTIFSQKKFQQESEKFINVYIDGDSANAQKWSDHFNTQGYPTMLILNPFGQEITRMATGLSLDQYVSLMQKIRLNLVPIDKLVTKALAKKASEQEYERLAGYSWDQDTLLEKTYLNKKNSLATYKKLHLNAPFANKPIWAHFFLRYYVNLLDKNKLTIAAKKDATVFLSILKDKDYYNGNVEFLIYYSDSFKKIFSKNIGITLFNQAYLSAMQNIRQDEKYSLDERLSTLYVLLTLEENKAKTYSTQSRKLVKHWALKAQKVATDKHERQATLGTAISLLNKSGQVKLAKKIALQEIDNSPTAYFYMSYLGSMEEKQQHFTSALKWYHKAWVSSLGHATRFQWGSSYLIKLLTLTPNDIDQINLSMTLLLNEILIHDDAFNGRNLSRFERIKKALLKWKKQQNTNAMKLSSMVLNRCQEILQVKMKKQCLSWAKF